MAVQQFDLSLITHHFGTVQLGTFALKGISEADKESYSLPCSGMICWQGGNVLCHWLLSKFASQIFTEAAGKASVVQNFTVLELGCGLGLAGMLIRNLFPQVNVVLTDGDAEAVSATVRNCLHNGITCSSGTESFASESDSAIENTGWCRVEQLRWGVSAQLESFLASYCDCRIVVAADVLYQESQVDPLMRTVAAVLSNNLSHAQNLSCRFVLSYTRRGVPLPLIFETAKLYNLEGVIHEHGCLDIFGEECSPECDLLSNCVMVFELVSRLS